MLSNLIIQGKSPFINSRTSPAIGTTTRRQYKGLELYKHVHYSIIYSLNTLRSLIQETQRLVLWHVVTRCGGSIPGRDNLETSFPKLILAGCSG